MWCRVFSVGIGLLKLSKLSGVSSWIGDHLATIQDLMSIVMLLEGRLLLEGRALFPWLWKVQWQGDCYWKGEHFFHGHGRYSVKLAMGKSD